MPNYNKLWQAAWLGLFNVLLLGKSQRKILQCGLTGELHNDINQLSKQTKLN